MKKPTIYDIKYKNINAPYFFNRKTLKFFGQTMKSFIVFKTENPLIFRIAAYRRNDRKSLTQAFFNTETNKLCATPEATK